MSALLISSQFVSTSPRGDLPCLEIRHPLFSASLLLQGAQLLSFAPAGDNSWLWLSEQAEYLRGTPVRGGIPLCWPWFGNAALNPTAVKAFIQQPGEAPAHGFARSRDWQLRELYEDADEVVLTLSLSDTAHEQWLGDLSVEAEFRFTASSLSVVLTSTNQSTKPVSFSQALHSYFPTSDIHATRIAGLDGAEYLETLAGWERRQQTGDIHFSSETDRIYYSEDSLSLITPEQRTELSSQGSNSAVVWNPWIEKSQRLSQFAPDAYQRMFCVETANAADDAITLKGGESHSMSLQLTRV